MIQRSLERHLRALARRHPVVTITGPRQAGKTTLCRMAFPRKPYVSLEDPDVRDYASADPRGFLEELPAGAILDEIQRVPELPSYLQGVVDRHPVPGRFVLTGSQHLGLLRSVSQSLAGRTAVVHLLPLAIEELRRFGPLPHDPFEMIFRGGYPAIHDRSLPPREWYASYVETYVERDVRQVLEVGNLTAFRRFVRLAAGRTGRLVNHSALGADAGVTHATARSWLSVLETSFLVHELPPLQRSLRKRLVKSPKLHFLDSGLVCYLLGIRSAGELRGHPLRGAVFESWVVAELLKAHHHCGDRPPLFFYRDRKGLEVDAVVELGRTLVAVEAKSGRTPARDFFDALQRFASTVEQPTRRLVIYAGEQPQRRARGMLLPCQQMDAFDWRRGRFKPGRAP